MNEDYIFQNASLIDWQKWFNQWKHDYKLEILNSMIFSDGVTILLKRTKLK